MIQPCVARFDSPHCSCVDSNASRRVPFRFAAALAVLAWSAAAWAAPGSLTLSVIDAETRQPVCARMHLTNSRGRSIHPRGAVGHADYFLVDQQIVLTLPPDTYEFTLEKGPEYRGRHGHFEIARGRQDEKRVSLERIVDLRQEGWWSGDLLVGHPWRPLERMMAAEDLHVACQLPDASDQNDPAPPDSEQGPWIVPVLSELQHPSGDVARLPMHVTVATGPAVDEGRLADSVATNVKAISTLPWLEAQPTRATSLLVATRPYARDMPAWLALGHIDAISLFHGNLRRTSIRDDEDHGLPRDRVIYPPPHGNARWSFHVYQQILNAGLRIVPVACSESGRSPNPVGYNRVYVHCDGPPRLETWWRNLQLGRVLLTNGPLLRVRYNDQLPGHTFHAATGETVTVQCSANLATREKIQYLQVIQDGQVVHDARLETLAGQRGQLPPVTFQRSGWIMVRVITTAADTYRAACSGPAYVQIGASSISPRYDPAFWNDWTRQEGIRMQRDAPEAWPQVVGKYRLAHEFFAKRTE